MVLQQTTKKPKAYTGYTPGTDEIIDNILDEREVAGLVGEEKIELVERIQAHARGTMARKQVSKIRTTNTL